MIAHNLRSVHNVGALLRTGEVFAVEKIHTTGFTPYPTQPDDSRDARLRARQTRKMAKSAAGAEHTMPLTHGLDVHALIDSLHGQGYVVAGLENDPSAEPIDEYRPGGKIALILGDEVHGIQESLQDRCDMLLQIPVFGGKNTLNVSVAAGIALYLLRTR